MLIMMKCKTSDPPSRILSLQESFSISSLLESLQDAEKDSPKSLRAASREAAATVHKSSKQADISSTKAKYRKDSVDSDSIRTREQYQKHQADRVRKAYRDGKRQEMLVRATTRLAEPSQVKRMHTYPKNTFGLTNFKSVESDGLLSNAPLRDLACVLSMSGDMYYKCQSGEMRCSRWSAKMNVGIFFLDRLLRTSSMHALS